jgi:signal peptidase I
VAKNGGAPSLAESVKPRLSAGEWKAVDRTRWLDRFTSLWAPISIFGLVFAVYLCVVEFYVCAYPPLQPWLQGFGLIMLACYFALVGARVVARKQMTERKLRGTAEELISEVEGVADKNREALKGKVWDDVVAAVAEVMKDIGTRNAANLRDHAGKLSELAEKQLKKYRRSSPADFASGFVKALAVALLIRSFIVEPFKIPSGSMIPTLEIGDQIFVNKFIYGVRVPFLDKVPFKIVREPRRGDVIVFFNRLVGKDFVKRIMGAAGDHIVLHGRAIRVNDREVPTEVEAEDYHFWDQTTCEASFFDCLPFWFKNEPSALFWRERIGTLNREQVEGRPHYTINMPDGRMDELDFVVPPNSVFVMGDDRDNSDDSRYGLGCHNVGTCPHPDPQFVPYDDIKGKATVIWLSLSHGGLFSSLFGGTGIRGDRFFQSVTMCGDEPKRH